MDGIDEVDTMTPKPEHLGCGAKGCIIERLRGQHVGTCSCLDGMDPAQRVKLRAAIARDRKRIAELEAELERTRRVSEGLL